MIAASALVSFLLSSGGLVTLFAIAAIWNTVSPGKSARRSLLALAITYALLSFEPVPAAGARWLARPFHPLTRADVPPGDVAIVLLGSGSYTLESWTGDRHQLPDLAAAERTLEAFRVFKLLDARWIVSSGGNPILDDPDEPSGRTMETMLVTLGVPSERIRVETKSRTTREEAVVVREMLPALAVQRVVLVTSATHMRRSLAVFRSVGLDPIPAIARQTAHNSPRWWQQLAPSARALDASEKVLHELLGMLYYRLRGWQV